MFFGLSRRKRANDRVVARLYDALTGASRAPLLYTAMGVPDTFIGRFEMLSAHLVVFFRRTAKGSAPLRDMAQDVVDAFFEDMDHSIRELGIGDMGVPKRMKKFARMFYGRLDSYGRALDAGDSEALAAAIGRNVHPDTEPPAGTHVALAHHLLALENALAGQTDDALLSGRIALPEPQTSMQESPQ